MVEVRLEDILKEIFNEIEQLLKKTHKKIEQLSEHDYLWKLI